MAPRKKKGGALRIYNSYVFRDKDPIVDAIRTCRQDVKFSFKGIEENGGAKAQTVRNWEQGKVRRPQFATVWASIKAMGKNSIYTGADGYPKIED